MKRLSFEEIAQQHGGELIEVYQDPVTHDPITLKIKVGDKEIEIEVENE